MISKYDINKKIIIIYTTFYFIKTYNPIFVIKKFKYGHDYYLVEEY